MLPDMVRQGERRLLAAAVRLPIGFASLPRLRRVDAEQADALAVDFDGIAVDDGCAAAQVACSGLPCASQGQDDEPTGHGAHQERPNPARSVD